MKRNLIKTLTRTLTRTLTLTLTFTFTLSLALSAILLLSACGNGGNGGNGGADAGIKIGLIAEITGQIPAVGASSKNAALMAVEEINSAGGIDFGGKKQKIRLIIEDSASKAEQAAAVAQKLITQDNVLAIVGPNSSSNAIPASEIAEGAKTLLVTPWSTNPKTTLNSRTGAPKEYVFRACFNDLYQGHVLGNFASVNLKAKKAAVLYDVASEAPKGQAELFKKSFESGGGRVVSLETYTTGDKDFSAQLTKIKSAAPDIIFLPSYYTDVPLVVGQARRLGIDVPFLGSDAWSTEELIKMCGKECEGFYLSNHYSAQTKNPAAEKFIAAYKTRYGTVPDDVAALTYDAFGLLAQALKTSGLPAGNIDRQAVRDAFANIRQFKGVTGDISFTPDSRDPVKGAVILQIKDGAFVWFAAAGS